MRGRELRKWEQRCRNRKTEFFCRRERVDDAAGCGKQDAEEVARPKETVSSGSGDARADPPSPAEVGVVCAFKERGEEMSHLSGKRERGLPELHFDHMFVGPNDAPGETRTCLVVREAETRMVMSIIVPAKGREQFAVDRAVSFIEEIGFLHQDLIVKLDQESAVRAVVEKVGKARAALGNGRWTAEHSPVRSSQSNGVVERAVQ